ncbi:hypothetical protein [Streptomyces sp. NPDC059909]|uniref:hypothetical protein n=1 Tax=Streptomyces sp. NPDC059909 TaxID=3346998 RepID=UPI00365BA91B
MHTINEATTGGMTAQLRAEWKKFRGSRGRILALTAATLVTILLGLLSAISNHASCSQGSVEVACPVDPVGPDGRVVSDQFFFAHRTLGENGSITVRMTSMTGIVTYPPPNHDKIVPGLVPWAKAGIIVKDGIGRGSAYAALMMTGSHGVRMQDNYTHDTAGRAGGVSARSPRWLRLTRSGATVTGYESTDGEQWTKVATARLAGLPATAQVGLFATSPGDLTLRPTGLGASIGESRFTQATGVFDHVSVGGASAGGWSRDAVGELGHTDWEKYHRAAGLVEADGTLTVTGSGDIGPIGTEGGRDVEDTLVGLVAGLIVLIVVAVRFATAEYRPGRVADAAFSGRVLAAKAIVVGAVTLVAGLLAAGVVLPVGTAIVRANGMTVLPVSTLTELRVVVGAAALVATAAVFALALGALLRRTWAALLVALGAVVLPYLLGGLPLLPDGVAEWLLRLSPAAGFAILQTVREYPQVVAHYVPSAGYFPLPGWAGFAVLCGHTAAALGLAVYQLRRRVAASPPQAEWR